VSPNKGHAMTQIKIIIYLVLCVVPEGVEAGTAEKQRKTQSISWKFVPLRVPCQGSQRQLCKGCAMTQILMIYFVFRCFCRGGGRHCRQAAQKKTKYVKIRVIACPLYDPGSQRQLCKGHAMTQILIIYFVSFVACVGAEAGTADRQSKTQIILKFVSLLVPCTVRAHSGNCARDTQWHKS
jgi:hypothetical protein